MSLIAINKNPSQRDLKWFGVVVAAFFGVVGALLVWQFQAWAAARIVWLIGVALAIIYYAVPQIRRGLYITWFYAWWPLGWCLSHLLLVATYYLVLTPVGLIMRLCGRDPMHRQFDRRAISYWTPRTDEPGRWFSQF